MLGDDGDEGTTENYGKVVFSFTLILVSMSSVQLQFCMKNFQRDAGKTGKRSKQTAEVLKLIFLHRPHAEKPNIR